MNACAGLLAGFVHIDIAEDGTLIPAPANARHHVWPEGYAVRWLEGAWTLTTGDGVPLGTNGTVLTDVPGCAEGQGRFFYIRPGH